MQLTIINDKKHVFYAYPSAYIENVTDGKIDVCMAYFDHYPEMYKSNKASIFYTGDVVSHLSLEEYEKKVALEINKILPKDISKIVLEICNVKGSCFTRFPMKDCKKILYEYYLPDKEIRLIEFFSKKNIEFLTKKLGPGGPGANKITNLRLEASCPFWEDSELTIWDSVLYIVTNSEKEIVSVLYEPKCHLQLGDDGTNIYELHDGTIVVQNRGDVQSLVFIKNPQGLIKK